MSNRSSSKNFRRIIPPFEYTLIAKCINSSIASIISAVLMYPLDLSKTRLQNQRNIKDSRQLYSSLIDCVVKIRKAEGVRGLYRGCAVASLLIAPEKTVKLVSNDFTRRFLKQENEPLPLRKEILAGGVAGLAQSLISTPMDLLKIQLQDEGRLAAMNNSTLKETNLSARKIALELIKKEGALGLFRGIGPTGGRNVFFSMLYFPIFFKINNLGPTKNDASSDPSPSWAFLSGVIAGAVGAALATPFDVIKTRMQRLKLAKCDVAYNGVIDAFLKIVKTEGLLALMKGAGIRMITIAPTFGIIQTLYYLGIGEYIMDVPED